MQAAIDDVVPVGMMHGRFHPFHLGHLHYAKLVAARCELLVVGITNPDSRHLKPLAGDAARHLSGANPFTYFERYRMIQGSLLDAGMDPGHIAIIPFTIDEPDLWPHYLPTPVVHFLRDRGEWTQTKMQTLATANQQAHLIQDTLHLDIEGTNVRQRIIEGGDWQHLVPPATARVLNEIKARERLRAVVK